MHIWQTLKQQKEKDGEPVLVLAPMADVTDYAFREIITKYGKPDVLWTEFVSAEGLFLGGRDALIHDLRFSEAERPIIAQFFTSNPDMMEQAAALARELGFDGIDINMGCPDRGVEKQGAGASLIKNPTLAKELVLAAKRGAGEVPVSVKTRVGYNKVELDTWLPALLSVYPAVVTVHARTRKELSLVPARWEHVAEAVRIRDELQKDISPQDRTLIFGNGDVKDTDHARRLAQDTGADGVMLGRAIFGNPWLFSLDGGKQLTVAEKCEVMIEHTKLFEQTSLLHPPAGPGKSFALMKKHYKAYIHGFPGAKELRIELMEGTNSTDIEEKLNTFLQAHPEIAQMIPVTEAHIPTHSS